MNLYSGVVDYRGHPAPRLSTGRWTSAAFIVGVEMAERFAYYGITSNLISYLTGPLRETMAAGAANENLWSGAASSLALLGAFVADSRLGRYQTVLYSSFLDFLGLAMLTLSATLPSLKPPPGCNAPATDIAAETEHSCAPPSTFQVAFFFFSLYLVAFAHGGHKPCAQAFGADQFDIRDPEESKCRSSFFNWWYTGVCAATITSQLVLSYVQDSSGWALGFGVPCIAVGLASVQFYAGTRTYRYHPVTDESPFLRIIEVCGESLKNSRWMRFTSRMDDDSRVALLECGAPHGSSPPRRLSEDDVKGLATLLPILTTCVIYALVFAQPPTLFTEQGSTMERHIGSSGFQIPAAAVQSCIGITTLMFLPIYDLLLVLTARKLTMLQRVGVGMLLCNISTMVAALVEMKRLRTAREWGLVGTPGVAVPMSIWWLVPQNVLFGVADAFATVGMQEFFYDQVPECLRSLGLAMHLCVFGVGRFLSGLLISVIDGLTGGKDDGWFANNLNRAHLDYFFWLLTALGSSSFVLYLQVARRYVYKNRIT